MSPSIAPPSPEAIADLMSANAARFAEKSSVDVIDDNGETIRLPLVLGNPTGSVKPPGSVVLPVWADLIALTMGAKGISSDGVADALARDCLLYPSPAQLGQWEERWPAVIELIGSAVVIKIGMDEGQVVRAAKPKPTPGDAAPPPPPPPPGTFLLGRKKIPAIIKSPTRAHYVALKGAVRREGADHVALLDDLLAACVKGNGVEALLVEQPGLALPIYKTAMRLAGDLAAVRVGEW